MAKIENTSPGKNRVHSGSTEKFMKNPKVALQITPFPVQVTSGRTCGHGGFGLEKTTRTREISGGISMNRPCLFRGRRAAFVAGSATRESDGATALKQSMAAPGGT